MNANMGGNTGGSMNSNMRGAMNSNMGGSASGNMGGSMNSNMGVSMNANMRGATGGNMNGTTGGDMDRLPTTPGSYFVIVGSFRKADERGKADARLSFMRGRGYDARIIDSDGQPNLTPGLWVVVLGPFEKSVANRWAAQLRAVAPEGAYVKAGR
jgi:hypothetical protein